MKSLAQEIKDLVVEKGNVGVFFLGQAGFLFKTSTGKRIVVDAYLSDSCNRLVGFKRLMPYLISADEIQTDYLLVSHEHPDHFDVDSIPAMASANTKLFMANDCKKACVDLGLNNVTYMAVGDSYQDEELSLTAVPCDHGKDTPDALGFLLKVDGKSIYLAGDTCYREDIFKMDILSKVDAFIFPINGAFGNLDGVQAGKACQLISPKLAIPCHYWNFAQHFGSPYDFMTEMEALCPEIPYLLMRQGELKVLA